MRSKHKKSSPDFSVPRQFGEVRTEIAAVAAKIIALEGASYVHAKHKAAQQVLGSTRFSNDFLPDNAMVEQQVLLYNQLFLADSQPARLLQLRRLALRVMRDLQAFEPQITGAVLSGTAGEHSEIVLHLFVDNTKEIAILLLNKGVEFEVSEYSHEAELSGSVNRPLETLSFILEGEGVHLVLFDRDDLRQRPAKSGTRAKLEDFEKLVQ